MNPEFQKDNIVESLVAAAAPYEFDTFVVGFERSAAARDPSLLPLYRQLKIEVGTELLRRWPDRRVEFKRPEARLDVHLDLSVLIRPVPLFLAARYRKLSRCIPASRWNHLACQGKGCEGCSYTGDLCGPSIQDIFAKPLLRLTRGEETSFHGLGREDTDARMLGRGRPFVMEVQNPRRRNIDLQDLIEDANRSGRGFCELLEPAIVDRTMVRTVKEADAEKTYRAWIRFGASPPEDSRELIESLAGRTIEQFSPTRVMRRRGEKIMRPKKVFASRWMEEIDGLGVWEVRAQSGTYIKELISGDHQRTRPSVTELLGVSARCVALDVVDIHWSPPWENRTTEMPETRETGK